MSETKHRRIFTEGPWSYREAFDNGEPCGYVVQSGVIAIADVPQGEDDARLISAAPDLLSSLTRCLEYMELTSGKHGLLKDECRAAIAKAKGEA